MEHESSGRDIGGQIRELTRVLREQWWIIALCVVVTTFAAAAYTSTQHKRYEASAKLLLQADNLSSTISGVGVVGADPTRQAATDAQLVALPVVADRVTKALHQPLSAANVRTAAGADTNLLTVTVNDPDPAQAARFANAFANQYIGFRRDTSRTRYMHALQIVQTRLAQTRPNTPDAATLRAQAKQLKLLVSLQTGDAQLVQGAVQPTAPVAPKPTRNLMLGGAFGLLLGLGLAFLRDRLDRRVKREDQIERLLPGVPIIGLIPEARRRRASRLMTAEGFHTLGTNIGLLSHDRELKTLLVTSAIPEEGKSTIALNLALAMREKGRSVLVLDADLRRPSLSERLKADRRVGVSSILAGGGTVAESTQELAIEASSNGNGPSVALSGEVPIVPAGPAAANPQLLLSERSLLSLLEASRARAEIVIFDGPPMGAFSDMLPLATEVDGVIVAVRLYHSRSDQLRRFATQLANASIKPLGVVVLGAAGGPSQYYSDYLKKR